VMSRIQKALLIVIFEVIAIYLISHSTNYIKLDAMAEILATLFALVFLLPQIVGKFVLKPRPQNLHELYPRSLYFIAFVFALGIILPISGITFDLGKLPLLNLAISLRNVSLFLFLNSIMLLVLFFNNILRNISFVHNLKASKEKCVFSITFSRREDYKSWTQSIKGKCEYAIGKFYELMWGDLQSHIEKIRSAIESLLAVDECHITGCIEDIFEVIEYLLINNRSEYYEGLLYDIIKTSSVNRSYAMKKSVINGLTKLNLRIIRNIEDKSNKNMNNEIMKKNIKVIAQIGSSSLEFNRDTLIVEAQKSLRIIFDECLKKNLDEFDYSVFVYSLVKLAEKAFEDNIKEAIRESIAALVHITTSFKDRELRINPTMNALETLRDIGIKCAEKRWENLLFNCFNTLLYLRRELSEDYLISLSSVLIIASYCNKHFSEVLPNIEKILEREIDDLEEVKEYSSNYTKSYSQIQHSVLRKYLDKFQS